MIKMQEQFLCQLWGGGLTIHMKKRLPITDPSGGVNDDTGLSYAKVG